MRIYKLTVKHDKGVIRITTNASNEDQAIRQVMSFEGCPRRSIVKVVEVKS